jgi:hypothetical protein
MVIVFFSITFPLLFPNVIVSGRTRLDAKIIAGVSKIEEIKICHLRRVSTEADLLPKKIINIK